MLRALTTFATFAMFAAVTFGPGCGPAIPAESAERTAPPKLNILPKGEIHTAMWELAGAVTELDAHMRYEESANQTTVVDNLRRMVQSIDQIAKSDLRNQHPMLSSNIDLFRADVQKALDAASAEPPNYYLAGAVTGGCVYCHDPGGGLR